MYKYGENAPCYSAPKALEEDCHESLRCEDFKNWSYSIDNVDGSAVIRHHGITLTQDEKKWKSCGFDFTVGFFFVHLQLKKVFQRMKKYRDIENM